MPNHQLHNLQPYQLHNLQPHQLHNLQVTDCIFLMHYFLSSDERGEGCLLERQQPANVGGQAEPAPIPKAFLVDAPCSIHSLIAQLELLVSQSFAK